MTGASPLADLFLPHLDEPLRLRFAASPALQDTLAAVLGAAASRYPTITLGAEVFLPFLARRLPGEFAAPERLLDLELGDLYLLCAYGEGAPRAVTLLEERHMTRVEAGLQRLGATREMIEDIRQILHQRLLSADHKDVRHLRYNGKGELVRWLYVAATRMALDTWRKEGRVKPVEDDQLERRFVADDHETAFLKLHYRAQFKEAFQEAFAALSNQERNLLRYNVLEQLNIEQIGAIYRVHRATVARWIAKARQQLLVKTRALMLARLKATPHTFESVMRLIESELEVSIRRLLQESPREGAPA